LTLGIPLKVGAPGLLARSNFMREERGRFTAQNLSWACLEKAMLASTYFYLMETLCSYHLWPITNIDLVASLQVLQLRLGP